MWCINDETNVNKLSKFNLGLANFKPLEESYGDVEILCGRRTDILVLQEDKISYVLASKNIISVNRRRSRYFSSRNFRKSNSTYRKLWYK